MNGTRMSTSMVYANGINSIQRQQTELARLQQQLATGRRILSPSDDPAGAVQSLKFREGIAAVDQYARNAMMANTRLELEESVLAQFGDVLQRGRELALTAANGTQTNESRAAIAVEIRQLADALVDLGNTRDANGEYLFAGYRSTEPPFVRNGGGEVVFQGDGGQRRVAISPDRSVAVGDSGDAFMRLTIQGVADPDDDPPVVPDVRVSMFGVLDDMATALSTPRTTPAAVAQLHDEMNLSLQGFDQALGRVLELRTGVGTRLNTIERQSVANDDHRLQLQTALSQIEDLDYAEAISRFNLQQVALEAAQTTYVQFGRLSLFDYLK